MRQKAASSFNRGDRNGPKHAVTYCSLVGGGSGDSSMNPFTGDSYAYFHGGHNLGEQGTIFPDHAYRTPPGKAQEPKAVRKPASGPQADARVGRTPRNDLPQSPASQ